MQAIDNNPRLTDIQIDGNIEFYGSLPCPSNNNLYICED